MSYVTVLNDAASRADAASTKAEGASNLLFDIVNGPQDTFVTTASGSVPTAATAIEDLRSQITAGVTAPISESVTLSTAGQTNVTFSNVETSGLALYVDNGTAEGAYRYFNYTVDGTSSIILGDSFAAGTIIWGLSQEIGGDVNTAVQQTQANAQLAEDWAILTGTTVDGVEYSSKKYAQDSSASASAAATSETNAATSESNALTYSQNALSSQNLAEDWATLTTGTVNGTEYSSKYYSQQSSTSASNAATSETNAATSASNALASENAAATSASNAATSESNAATSATNAANTYDQFDDRYLGSKASDPATDNDGNAIITGAVYWNTSENRLKVYTGTAWTGFNADLLDGKDSTAFEDAGAVANHVALADPHTQYLQEANNLSDLNNLSTARANLSVVERTSLTGSAVVPSGTQAQRDTTPAVGYLRFNSDTGLFEGYNGTGWVSVGAGATGSAGDQVFVENDQVVTTSYTIPSDKNASTTGPITINSGVTVTVSDGARWVVL